MGIIMEKVKKLCNRILIEGLSGMAQGLFATLLVGTILEQIGGLNERDTGGLRTTTITRGQV